MSNIWYTIYTQSHCSFCKLAKELLLVEGIDFVEIDINDEGVREMFSEKGLRTVPQVFIEERHLGGYNSLANYIKEKHIEQEKEYRKRNRSGNTYLPSKPKA